MTPSRQLLLLGTLCAALALIVKSAQISLAFDPIPFLRALVSNLAIQFLLAGVGTLWLLSLCVVAWERSERRHAEWCERMDEQARWDAERRKEAK